MILLIFLTFSDYICNRGVLSDEQMSKRWPFSLLNDEQMSNKVRVEHQPTIYDICIFQTSRLGIESTNSKYTFISKWSFPKMNLVHFF